MAGEASSRGWFGPPGKVKGLEARQEEEEVDTKRPSNSLVRALADRDISICPFAAVDFLDLNACFAV